MKILFSLLVCLLSVMAQAQKMEKFSHDSIPFTATYPAEWEHKIKIDKRVFFTSPLETTEDEFRENVNIAFKENKEFTSAFKLSAIEDAVVESLKKSYKDFKLEQKSAVQFSGSDALQIVYSGFMVALPATRIRIRQVMCSNQGKLWTVTYTSRADTHTWDLAADAIIKSIVVVH